MADRKIRVGIIGTGGIAHCHMGAYLKREDVEVVAGADIIEGKAEAFFKEFGVEAKCYNSHTEMLADESLQLDAVSVCTNHANHKVCTVDSLAKGINVLVEKPMCVTLEEAIEMCEAEKKYGKIISVGFQPRFDKNMQLLKKIVQSGELGKVYYVQTGGGRRHTGFGTTTFFEKELSGGIGAVGDIGCYALDMVLNALGNPKPLTVSGYTSNYFGTRPDFHEDHPEYAEKFEVDDFAAAFVRLEGDIILDFRISWAMHMDTAGDTLILGTEGGLRIPSTDCWNGGIGPMVLYKNVAGRPTETVIPKVDDVPWDDLWLGKIGSFIDAVKNGTPSPIPTSDIINNQAIIGCIVKSAKEGREIKVELPEF